MESIPGGATIWARRTIDSVIFYDKPDKWFKIWFFLVNKANHKDFKRWERGGCHVTYEEIKEHTRATKNQIDHCIRFLKKEQMLATRKATRGMQIEVLKYSLYQDLNNYKSDTESEVKAKQKRHRSDTINKYDKNEKNISDSNESGVNNKSNVPFNKYGDDYMEEDLQIDPDHKPKTKKIEKKVSTDIQAVFNLFNNPARPLWVKRDIERIAAQALFDTYGIEKLTIRMKRIESEKQKKDPYFPEVNTPSQLLDKMPNVERYLNL